tara:strand:- start:1909 stop:2346 length:438 start_codon:yes stop_codon:yes gene_type:complete
MAQGLNFVQVYNRLQGIASGETTRMSGRELRNMIRHIDVDNSRLSNLTQSDLNRMYNVTPLLGASRILIEHTNNQQLKEQRISIWLNRANYAIRVHSNNNSNSNNRRTTDSKKSASTKLSKAKTNKIKKSTPGTPQSKRRKKPNK